MQYIEHAVARPYRCAVLPYIGNSNGAGFIDTGSEIASEHVYVSLEAAAEMARFIGWTPPSEADALKGEITALRAKLDQAEADRREADKFAESAEFTLAHFGQKIHKKPPGRPKKESANA